MSVLISTAATAAFIGLVIGFGIGWGFCAWLCSRIANVVYREEDAP